MNSRVLLIILSTLFAASPLVFDPFAELSFEPIKVATLVVGAGVIVLWSCKAQWSCKAKSEAQSSRGASESWLRNMPLSVGVVFRLCVFGYFASLLLSTIFSIAPQIAFWGTSPRYQGFLLFLAVFIVMLSVSSLKREHLVRLAEIMLITGFAVSILGIFQIFLPLLTQWWDIDLFLGRIFSTMGHPNYLADYLILLIPLLYWKFLESKKWYLWVIIGGVMLLSLLLTLSRGAWLGCGASLLFFLIAYSRQKRTWKPVIACAVVGLGIFVGVVSLNIWHRTSTPLDRIPLLNRLATTGENLRSIESRLILWPTALKKALERPLLGYGPDTFAIAFSPAVPPEILRVESFNSYPDRAHNFFLDSLMNVGLPGTILLLGVIICALWVVVRSGDTMIFASGSALFGHIISQQFEFSLSVHLMIFWSYLGMIFAVSGSGVWEKCVEVLERHFREKCMWTKRVGTIKFAYTLAAIVAMYFSASYSYGAFVADRMAGEGRYEQAFAVMPSRIQYALDDVRQKITQFENQPENEQNIRSLLEKIKQFTAGADYRPHFYEGIYEMLLEKYPQSYAAFERALALAPSYPPIYRAYGRSLLAGGRYEEAISRFQQYVDLAPPYWKMKEPYARGELPAWEKSRFEVFYKQNPSFDEVFTSIEEAKIKLKSD